MVGTQSRMHQVATFLVQREVQKHGSKVFVLLRAPAVRICFFQVRQINSLGRSCAALVEQAGPEPSRAAQQKQAFRSSLLLRAFSTQSRLSSPVCENHTATPSPVPAQAALRVTTSSFHNVAQRGERSATVVRTTSQSPLRALQTSGIDICLTWAKGLGGR